MLKAIVSYSKKVPVPGCDYSSQGYSLTMETEIPETDPQGIQAHVHGTFELVKASVELELANGQAKADPVPAIQEDDADPPKGDSDRASERQVRFILDLAERHNLTIGALDAHVMEWYGVCAIEDLSKPEASRLVDWLKGGCRVEAA